MSVLTDGYNAVVRFVNERILRREVYTPEILAEPQGKAKGRSVNLFTEGWGPAPGNTRVPRHTFGVHFVWTDDYGIDHDWQDTLIFPDVLLDLPLEDIQGRVEDWLIEIARARAGVDA